MLSHSIQTGYSWVILFIFSSNLTTLGLQTYTLSSIAPSIRLIYSIEEIYIEMCSFIFFINYTLFLVPAYYFDDYFDSRMSIILGSVLSFVGACLRIGCIQSFWWIVIGSFVSSIAQPFLLNQVTKLSVLWFKSEKRARATSISMVFFMLGGGGSYAVSGSMINESSGKQDVFYLMILEAFLCLISLLLIIAFFKDKKSDSESFLLLMNKGDIKSDLIQVIKNKNFMLLFLSTIISCGNANFFAVTISFITEYYGIGANETSLLGTICTFSGLASCLIAGYISSLIGKYKKICLVTMSLSGPCYLFFFLVQRFDILPISVIVASLLGINIMPIYSLGLEMACEIAFPVREVITSGLINCFTQLYGLIPIFIAYLFGNNAVFIIGLLVCQQILSVILMILTNENLKRKYMKTVTFARERSCIEVSM